LTPPDRCTPSAGHCSREVPPDLLELVDVRRFGPGERIVAQPYTREMFDRTQGWMRERELLEVGGTIQYDAAVLH
jgi:hypothetical protein